MIKAYAEPKGHFVEVKLTNEELSDPFACIFRNI